MLRGGDPATGDWVKVVEWKTLDSEGAVGGTYELIQPLTTLLPPRLLVLDLASSNSDPSVATAGDVVVLTIVASRMITRPSVLIGGVPATAEPPCTDCPAEFTGTQWIASRQVAAGEPEGILDISVRRSRTCLATAGSLRSCLRAPDR